MSNPVHSNFSWLPWAGLFVVVFIIGGGVHGGDELYALIDKWQTLITGILAIIAARWTIVEMRRAYEAQQQQRALDDLDNRIQASVALQELITEIRSDVTIELDELSSAIEDKFDPASAYDIIENTFRTIQKVQPKLLSGRGVSLYRRTGIDPIPAIKSTDKILEDANRLSRLPVAFLGLDANGDPKAGRRLKPNDFHSYVTLFEELEEALDHDNRAAILIANSKR